MKTLLIVANIVIWTVVGTELAHAGSYGNYVYTGLVPTAPTVSVPVQTNSFTPTTVVTTTGTYIVVPNYTTGQPAAVIQTSK